MAPHRIAPGVAAPVGGAYGGLVDGDAQARPVTAQGVSLDEAERLGVDDVGQQVGGLVVVDAAALFLDQEVRCRERELQTGGQGDGPSGQCGARRAP